MSLRTDCDHVAHLKWSIRLQGNSREEVPESVLKCKSEDDAEDCGSRKQRAQVDLRKDEGESDEKENRKRDDREDVSDERRRVYSFQPKGQREEDGVEG